MKHKIAKLTIAAAFILLLVLFFGDLKNLVTDSHKLEEIVRSYGVAAPLAYLAIYVMACVFFLPGALLSVAGGAAFGFLWGTVYTVVGATLGAAAAFGVSRFLVGSPLAGFWRKRSPSLEHFDEKIKRNGFWTVFVLRIIPLFPFNGINFSFGMTGIKFKDYVAATFLGIIPGSAVYVYFGDSVAQMKTGGILISLTLAVLLSVAGFVYRRHSSNS